ncbi:Transmembrane 6 superfamily member 2 [Mactra antiquata]
MDSSQPPITLLVFVSSLLAAPLIYTLDKLAAMEDSKWIFAAGVVILPLFGLLCKIFVQYSPAKREPLFYVWSIFSFTAVVDMCIALELDGYIKGFMEFYLREGEPYLRSSYGTMINYWDGTGHFAMYLGLIYLLCSGKNYRILGLYWVGSITHSMIVFMPGNVIGNKGIRWSYLLNVPYVYYPIYSGVRFLRDGMKIKHKQISGKTLWERCTEWIFGLWFVVAILIAMFRYVACMGCKEKITQFYLSDVEPYLNDPYQYGRTQALCYFYYFIPMYVASLCCLIFPGQTWIKDWSLIHAGASIQAQLVYIWASLKWRTETEYQVPDTVLARSIFWPVNISLVIVPHLYAMYCHREEIYDFFTNQIVPSFKTEDEDVNQSNEKVLPQRRVTRSQKKQSQHID